MKPKEMIYKKERSIELLYNKTIDLSDIVLSDIKYLKEQNKSLINNIETFLQKFYKANFNILLINDILNSTNSHKVKINKINKTITKYFKEMEEE